MKIFMNVLSLTWLLEYSELRQLWIKNKPFHLYGILWGASEVLYSGFCAIQGMKMNSGLAVSELSSCLGKNLFFIV